MGRADYWVGPRYFVPGITRYLERGSADFQALEVEEAASEVVVLSEPSQQTFHLFSKLPPEIQSIIWEYHRQSEGTTRHYIMLANGRTYCAISTKSARFADTLNRQKVAPPGPLESHVELTGNIATAPIGFSPMNLVRTNGTLIDPPEGLQLSRPNIWVDFVHDIFIFHSRHKFPGEMRFLYHSIGAKAPLDISDDHWAFKIQKLALMIPGQGRLVKRGPVLDQLDAHTLSRLINLKSLYIVLPVSNCDSRKNDPGLWTDKLWVNQERYTDIETVAANHSLLKTGRRGDQSYEGDCGCQYQVKYADPYKAELQTLFKHHGMQVDVKVVVDVLWL